MKFNPPKGQNDVPVNLVVKPAPRATSAKMGTRNKTLTHGSTVIVIKTKLSVYKSAKDQKFGLVKKLVRAKPLTAILPSKKSLTVTHGDTVTINSVV